MGKRAGELDSILDDVVREQLGTEAPKDILDLKALRPAFEKKVVKTRVEKNKELEWMKCSTPGCDRRIIKPEFLKNIRGSIKGKIIIPCPRCAKKERKQKEWDETRKLMEEERSLRVREVLHDRDQTT